jgi:predicted TIM-barrel fold metal-dependent hydrolase
MLIDMHAHIGDLRKSVDQPRQPMTVDDLLRRLDREAIDRAVLLPWPPCPEAIVFPGLFSETPDIVSQARAAAAHTDRLIPFGNADPRWGGNSADTDFGWLLEQFMDMGCIGMGEVSANIPFDDPRTINLFRQCGERGLPVTIESSAPGSGYYGFVDDVGSPRLERLLKEAGDTIVIGHGPGFWAEMGSPLTVEDKAGYPSGPLQNEGSLWRLFRTYQNLYADLSANSGYNALTRDPEEGIRFLTEFQERLMFGTDVCFDNFESPTPIQKYLEKLVFDGRLDREAFDKIAFRNALEVLRLPAE